MKNLLTKFAVAASLMLGACSKPPPPPPPPPAPEPAPNISELRAKAEKGDVEAQTSLGVCYQFGTGVPKNQTEGVKWFLKAAHQGYAVAQFSLGLIYSNGFGIPVNRVEGYKWFLLAGGQGHEDSKAEYAKMEPTMNLGERTEGQRLAHLFKPKTAVR